jgi:hypothetical protein
MVSRKATASLVFACSDRAGAERLAEVSSEALLTDLFCTLQRRMVLDFLLLLLNVLTLFSQGSRWDAQQLLEMAVEMALISKADGMSHLSNRAFSRE